MFNLFTIPARFILFLVLFLFVIPMKLNGIKVSTPVVSVFLLFPCALFFYFLKQKITKDECLFCVSFLVAIAFCVIVFFRQEDNYPLQLMVIGFVCLCGAIALVRLYSFAYGDVFAEKILFHLMFIGFINAGISLMVLIDNGAANVVYGLVSIADNGSVHLAQGYRSSGLFYSGASSLSVFNAILFFMGLLLFFKIKPTQSYFSIIPTSLVVLGTIVFATFVAGRLGLILIFALLCYFSFFRTGLIDRCRFLSFLLFGVVTSCFTLLYYVDYQKIEGIINWALELFINYVDSGEVSSSSSNMLFGKMYFLPDRSSDVLFGTGSFGRGDAVRYIDSDAGYILMIFFGGLLSIPIFLFPYLLSIKSAFHAGVSPTIRACVLWAIFCILMSNFKDVYLFGLNGVNQVMFVFTAIAIIQGRVCKTNRK